jgi:hypothetical protein
MRQRAKDRAPRRLALLAIAVVAIGAYALSPAIGGPSRLTTKRAKKLFYTKNQVNNRFYSKEIANARFLPRQTGEYSFTIDPFAWEGDGRNEQDGFVRFTDTGLDQTLTVHTGSLPSQFAGKGMRLSAIEVCYELTDATIDRFRVFRSGPVTSDPIPNQLTFLDDGTDQTGSACHRFSAPAAPVGGAAVLDLEATIDYTGAGTVDIGRTTAIFTP